MFERFTDRARQVLVLAEEEARILKHDYIGTEHILLGLRREEEGLAARVLESLGVTAERVRAEVVRIVGWGEGVGSPQLPFTPRAKKVLELALREALSLGHNYIATEHILLGLVREGGGVASRVLDELGADAERVRDEVVRALTARPAPPTREHAGLSDSLLDGAWDAPRTLAAQIGHELDRQADSGDLLVLLASVPGGLASRTLAVLGLDVERLLPAVEAARAEDKQSPLLPIVAEIDEVRREKEAAIEARDFQRAAELRDRERALMRRARDEGQSAVLADALARLGLD